MGSREDSPLPQPQRPTGATDPGLLPVIMPGGGQAHRPSVGPGRGVSRSPAFQVTSRISTTCRRLGDRGAAFWQAPATPKESVLKNRDNPSHHVHNSFRAHVFREPRCRRFGKLPPDSQGARGSVGRGSCRGLPSRVRGEPPDSARSPRETGSLRNMDRTCPRGGIAGVCVTDQHSITRLGSRAARMRLTSGAAGAGRACWAAPPRSGNTWGSAVSQNWPEREMGGGGGTWSGKVSPSPGLSSQNSRDTGLTGARAHSPRTEDPGEGPDQAQHASACTCVRGAPGPPHGTHSRRGGPCARALMQKQLPKACSRGVHTQPREGASGRTHRRLWTVGSDVKHSGKRDPLVGAFLGQSPVTSASAAWIAPAACEGWQGPGGGRPRQHGRGFLLRS